MRQGRAPQEELQMQDDAQATVDIACPAVDFVQQAQHSEEGLRLQPQVAQQEVDQKSTWLIDGGASCHVVGFDPGSYLQNRRSACVEILVGGGQRLNCDCIGDLPLLVPVNYVLSRITLNYARIIPGFGSNLISGPEWKRQDGL